MPLDDQMAIARARIAKEAELGSGFLDLSRLFVSELPREVIELTALRSLDCHGTQVSDLTPLAALTALQSLDCSETQVSELTPLATLTSLRQLNCSGCRLHGIPSAIRDYQRLQLYTFNSYVPGLPHGILSQSAFDDCFDRVRAHFADMEEGATDLTDIKLLLLGNGGVGKTQIARWLSGASFNPEWDSTHGIHILSQTQPDRTAARLSLRIWDFGGQDIYHGTHAMFLRGPVVVMLVWSRDRENRDTYDYGGLSFRNHPLAYWLDVVTHQASPNSPVLIVQNKCDRKEQEELRFPIREGQLGALDYPAELRVSVRADRGRAALEETLNDAILWLRDPERLGVPKIAVGRLNVQRRLEAMQEADMALPPEERRHRLLERQEFDAICAEVGSISSPELLLDYLNANGTIFYRPGLFSNRIILDLGWALSAIYAVFERKQVYSVLLRDGGRFSRAKLGLLVWHDFSDSDQKMLLDMMVSCGICFLHRRLGEPDDDAEYIAPDLLPQRKVILRELAARWDTDRPEERATFRYALLHGGVIRSIISKIGQMAGIDALYWRGGLCAFDAKTRSRLLIEEEMSEGWAGIIRIRTQAGQAAVLLQMAKEVVESTQTYLGMRPVAVEQSSPAIQLQETDQMSLQQEKLAMPEWYVSYAWGDDRTPEGRAREELIDRLCSAAVASGHKILRDKEVMSLGDSISAFMRRIGQGDRVFVILSEKYLRSPHCMFELHEVWRNSRQEPKAFLDRVRVYALPDTNILDPTDWTDWAIHWKKEHDALENRAREHGLAILGELGGRRLTQMRNFYTQVADILGTLADIVQPRTFEELERYGFNDILT